VKGSLAAALTAAGLMALVGGCARQAMPPGGPQDKRPPVVVATVPDTFAVVKDFSGPVVFRFDERISERVQGGSLDEAIVVSPITGRVRVHHGRQSLEVTVAGGFRPGLIYRVTLLPVIQDLFNNRLRDPFELVFSTGGALNASAVAGMVWDRITGRGVEPAEVLAYDTAQGVSEVGDTLFHVARADSGGIYVFRYLPPGAYRLVAFQDRNRNHRPDGLETRGDAEVTLSGPDTVILDVGVLAGDTTPARTARAEFLDSVTLQVSFDDYLDPLAPADSVRVTLARGDSVPPGPTPRVAHVFDEEGYRAYVQALADSVVRLDSLSVLDTALARLPRPDIPPALPGARRGTPPPRPDGSPAPGRSLILLLDAAPEPNVPFVLDIEGVVNVNGLGGGGGRVSLIRVPPPPPEPPPDTAAFGDTARVRDTTALPDTTERPDTTARPDTTRRARPDTIRVLRPIFRDVPGRFRR